jgi:hypothetical protein
MIERAIAAVATAVVPVALRALPFRTTLAICDAWPRTRGTPASAFALARRVDRWLARGRSLWRSTCLTRTLVLYTMLRQHGYRPRLHIGTAGPAHQFQAHAWISLGGKPLAEFASSPAAYGELLAHDA